RPERRTVGQRFDGLDFDGDDHGFTHSPHPEERSAGPRLEGWLTTRTGAHPSRRRALRGSSGCGWVASRSGSARRREVEFHADAVGVVEEDLLAAGARDHLLAELDLLGLEL